MPQWQSSLGQAFSSLAFGGFRRFTLALLFTSLGSHLLQTAMLWHVYEMTGSALLLGLSGLARAIPHVLLSLIGGVIADRINRIYLIQAGQLANAILLVVLAALALTESVEVWHLYAITFLNSAFSAATQPARTALVPSLVPHRHLVNAIALNATVSQASQVIGPALAGVTIATFGLDLAYLLSGFMYLAAMLAIVGVLAEKMANQSSEGPWDSFVNGMRFVRSRPAIMSLLLLDIAATVLGSYRALLPIFSESFRVGATGYGILSAAPGVGSLIGAAVMLSLGDMKYKGLYTVFGVLAYACALALLALSPWFTLTLVAASLLGATNSIQLIPRNSVILGISPDQLRGRVEAFKSMMSGGGPPLGYTLSGGLAALFGAPIAVVMGAAACAIVVGTIGILHLELRNPNLGSLSET